MLSKVSIAAKILKQEQGSIVAVAALAIPVVMGFAALVVDVGVLYLNRTELVNMTDAAALAGVQDLPGSLIAAKISAGEYAENNGKPGDRLDIAVVNNRFITINAVRTVELYFARVMGFNSVDVRAQAAAAVKPISGAAGVVPFGVVKQTLTYGTTYTLKEGGGSGYSGNYGALALGGNGASTYRDNIKYGYNGQIKIGDWVTTEPGNMSGPTSSGIDYRISLDPSATIETVRKSSPRIVIVPIIDALDGNGRSEVLVVGFGAFFLEGVGGNGNKNYVTGKFMQMVVPGDVADTATGYGLYGSTLVSLDAVE